MESHWYVRRTDPLLVRWGLLWRLYDIVQEVGRHSTCGVLPTVTSPPHCEKEPCNSYCNGVSQPVAVSYALSLVWVGAIEL